MLRRLAPRATAVLDRYRQGAGDIPSPGTAYAASGAATSYEEGLAATIEGMRKGRLSAT